MTIMEELKRVLTQEDIDELGDDFKLLDVSIDEESAELCSITRSLIDCTKIRHRSQ